MFGLAGANAVGVVLFGALYAFAGARYLSQAAFLGCLGALFVLLTVLWVRVESRNAGLGGLRRFGRIVIGLVVVALATPVVVLMPLFWLESHLPPEAGLLGAMPGMMAVVLIALVLMAAVNVVGAAASIGRAAWRRTRT
jgi:hypothetical protein